jgi:hypothetical protein
MWDVIRWIVFAPLAVFFAFLFLGNWYIVLAYRKRKTHVSWIPLLGGLSGAAALLVMPIEGAWRYGWVPLVVEWGTLPGNLHALIYHLFFKGRKGP